MSNKRKNARKKRQRRANSNQPVFDEHALHLLRQMDDLGAVVRTLADTADAGAAVQDQFDQLLSVLVEEAQRFGAAQIIEAARMAFLPWAGAGEHRVDPQASPAHVELLALIALAAEGQSGSPADRGHPEVQELSRFVSLARQRLDVLLNLSHLRAAMHVDRSDKLAFISYLVRGTQMMVRNSSYVDIAQRTVTELLDGNDDVRDALVAGLGFDARDAFQVFAAVHAMQQDQVNDRGRKFADAVNELMDDLADQPAEDHDELDAGDDEDHRFTPRHSAAMLRAFGDFFEPDADRSSVSIADLVTATGMAEKCVRAVIERFTVDVAGRSPADVVDSFTVGDNPLRPRPLIATSADRVLLPHHTLAADAVKENLEDHLKRSEMWEVYQKHRGGMLESRVRAAMESVLPSHARFWDSFHYFVPATPSEDAAADPLRYTKKVEGDHLVVVDDVALIVEDKAVAVSPLAKGGKTRRLGTDLTGIIKKAADQARRLNDLIERDGGIRLEDGWVDLTSIREIHTIAVSLDDLMSVTTATDQLVQAGLVDPANIPWTVSLHDLELIVELVDRPAEFLLYLRRRRDPLTTAVYMAPDELDLFLLFFDGNLWAEPDPDEVFRLFPFGNPPTAAERRRFRGQGTAYVTSHTDQLDAWHHAKHLPSDQASPKPRMFNAPAGQLIDELLVRGTFGALSIGATLLGGSTAFQKQMATQANMLLDNPHPGRSRQVAVPITQVTDVTGAWLFIWATHPTGSVDLATTAREQERYLRLKKHQLGMPRGALFVYDQDTRSLVHVAYDGHLGELPDDLKPLLSRLRPPAAMQQRLPPKAKSMKRSKRGRR